MNKRTLPALTTLTVLLSACGGGTANPPADPSKPGSPPPIPVFFSSCQDRELPVTPDLSLPAALPGGIFSGTFTNETSRWTRGVEILVSEDGRMRIAAGTASYAPGRSGVQMAVTVETAGNTFMGGGQYYEEAESLWSGSPIAGEVALSGLIADRQLVVGDWTASTGEAGCFEVSYDGYIYDVPQPAEDLAGSWQPLATSMDTLTSLTIDSDGRTSGQEAHGCTIDGNISLIDDRFGLYDVQATLAGCEHAGDYDGFAYLCPCGMPDIFLNLSIDNSERALRYTFTAVD